MTEKKLRKFQKKNVIPIETAEEQLQMLNDFYDVDTDFLDEGQILVVGRTLNSIKKAICRGILSIEQSATGVIFKQRFENEQKIEERNTVVYEEIGSKVRKRVDDCDNFSEKIVTVLCGMTGEDSLFFDKMGDADWKAAKAIGEYFLIS